MPWIYVFFSKDFEIYEEILPIHGLKNWTNGANIFASYTYQRISSRYTNFSFFNNGHGSSYVRQQIKFCWNFATKDWCFSSLFHCIIQIGNICAGFSEADSMKNTVDMVIKIIPQRCANDINYHQLIEMLK